MLSPDAVRRVPDLLGVPRSGSCGRPTASTPRASSAGRSPATSGSRTGAAGWWRSRAAGTSPACPAAWPTRTSDLEPFRAGGPVLLYVGRYTVGQAHPAPDPRARAGARPLRAAGAARAARRLPGRVGGRAPAGGRARDRAIRTCSSPAGAATRTCPTGLNAADLLVLPSVREQFGAVLVEAMACGLPVVAVERPRARPRSWTPARPAGSCRPDDEDAMVEALVEAVNGDAERRRRGERAYEEARAPLRLARARARPRARVRRGARGAGLAASAGRSYRSLEACDDRDSLPDPPLRPGAPRPHRRGRRRGGGGGAARLRAAEGGAVREEKRPWIERTLQRLRESEAEFAAARGWRTAARCPTWASASRCGVRVEPGRVRAHVARRGDDAARGGRARHALRDALERWYRRRARAEVAPRLDAAVARAGATLHVAPDPRPAHPLGLVLLQRRDELQLALLLAPPEILDYVVEHEVAHLEVHDHSHASGAAGGALPRLARARALAAPPRARAPPLRAPRAERRPSGGRPSTAPCDRLQPR